MNCLVIIDGQEFVIGTSAIQSLVTSTPDDIANSTLFSLLAKHPAATVRWAVACKEKLAPETAILLSKDKDLDILRSIVRNETFRKVATDKDLKRLFEIGDRNLRESIANNPETYENCEYNLILKLILDCKDSGIRTSLAENYKTPKRILKILKNDSDPDVRSAANRER